MFRQPVFFLTLLFILPGLCACSGLQRRFNEQDQAASAPAYYQNNGRHAAEAREELGLNGNYLTFADRQRLQERITLKDLEDQLTTRAEKAQYYQIKPSLRGDGERIQFLLLGSNEAKARWITQHGLNRQDTHSEGVAQAIENKDIALGMSESAVRESWGDPDIVEVAGDSVYGYQRWRYKRMVSGNDGYQRRLRSVYFEGGRVVGWETHDL
jgi:hypothetical protein